MKPRYLRSYEFNCSEHNPMSIKRLGLFPSAINFAGGRSDREVDGQTDYTRLEAKSFRRFFTIYSKFRRKFFAQRYTSLKENELLYQKVCLIFLPFILSIFQPLKWAAKKEKIIFEENPSIPSLRHLGRQLLLSTYIWEFFPQLYAALERRWFLLQEPLLGLHVHADFYKISAGL